MFMWIALLLAVYSSFLPFVQNYGNIVQYSTAYYGAVSAIERGVLAANLRWPGFDGESGWRRNGTQQTNTGNRADYKIQEFYNYGDDTKSSLYWNVKSSTIQIPVQWEGNVPADFWKDNFSQNYNALHYNAAEAIALWAVETIATGNYYSAYKSLYQTPKMEFSINFRLNPLLKERLKDPNYQSKNFSDSIVNFPLINWTIKGNKAWAPFSIIPNESVSARSIDSSKDTLLRWMRFNRDWESQLTFWKSQGVFQSNQQRWILNIISSQESDLQEKSYTDILNWTTGTNLTLDLVNLLLWPKRSSKDKGAIYPFLEYQVSTNGAKIADRFFTILWEWRVGNYAIRLQLKKPTLDQPALGNFTIIF